MATSSLTLLLVLSPTEALATDGSQWIHYPQQYSLLGGTESTVVGTPMPNGGCLFEGQMELDPGEQAIEVAQTAFQPSTCTGVFVTGTPPQGALAADAAGTPDAFASADATCPTKDASGNVSLDRIGSPVGGLVAPEPNPLNPLARQHSEGYVKNWWEDPLCIDVNSVKSTIKWDWDGIKVYCNCNAGDALTQYGWYTTSGWSLTEHEEFYGREPWTGTGDNIATPNSAYSRATAHFRNGSFCFTVDTHTQYDSVEARGLWNGKLVGEWASISYGGCNQLLHPHHRLQRTQN